MRHPARQEGNMDKLLMSKKEAAQILGISVRTLENILKRKLLISRKLGRRRMIPASALAQFARRDTLVISGRANDSAS